MSEGQAQREKTPDEKMIELQAKLIKALERLDLHNLGVVARYADRVNVMYAGKIRESASATDLYSNPRHPYTVGLLRSVPRLDHDSVDRLQPIEGEIPDGTSLPSGCAFRTRCQWAVDRCASEDPPMFEVEAGHQSSCWEWERVHSAAEVPAS